MPTLFFDPRHRAADPSFGFVHVVHRTLKAPPAEELEEAVLDDHGLGVSGLATAISELRRVPSVYPFFTQPLLQAIPNEGWVQRSTEQDKPKHVDVGRKKKDLVASHRAGCNGV